MWEIGIGADVSAKVGFHGATPTGQPSNYKFIAFVYKIARGQGDET